MTDLRERVARAIGMAHYHGDPIFKAKIVEEEIHEYLPLADAAIAECRRLDSEFATALYTEHIRAVSNLKADPERTYEFQCLMLTKELASALLARLMTAEDLREWDGGSEHLPLPSLLQEKA